MTRVLNLEFALAFGELAVLFVQSLGHVSHRLKIIVQCVLADAWVLIVLLLLQRVSHQFFPVLRERIVKPLPHLVLFVGEALGRSLLQNADLLLEIVH